MSSKDTMEQKKQLLRAVVDHPPGEAVDILLGLITGEREAAVREALTDVRKGIEGSSAMYPLYAELDREHAIDTARKVALGVIDERLAKWGKE